MVTMAYADISPGKANCEEIDRKVSCGRGLLVDALLQSASAHKYLCVCWS